MEFGIEVVVAVSIGIGLAGLWLKVLLR